MSRFRKLSHMIWHCQYYIVWVPFLTQGAALGWYVTPLQGYTRYNVPCYPHRSKPFDPKRGGP